MKRYPAYKDSGIEWIGIIPEHWSVNQLKREINRFVDYRGKTPEKTENGIPLITAKNIKNGQIQFELSKEYISEDQYPKWMVRGLPEKGDVLVTTEAPLGETGQIEEEKIALAQRIILLKAKKEQMTNRYLKYSFISTSCQSELLSRATGSTALGIKASKFKRILVLRPSLVEQIAISNYLDHKTHLINTLIEKKQKQIELLQEQRTAIINQAVTKGLKPNIKMKESGIDWLGELPEHWTIRRFKTLFEIKKRIAGSLGFDVLSITQQGIKIKDITSGDGQLAMDYSKYQLVHKGDFAMNQMDLLTGYVDISKHEGVTSPDYRVFVLKDQECHPEYFLYFLQMGYNNKLFFPHGQGAAHLGRWRLPTTAFKYFLAPCPPKQEQIMIAEYISAKVGQINAFIQKFSEIIVHLQEYRTTLISDVVTGKIDVRDEAIPE